MNMMTQFNHNQKSVTSQNASECFLLIKEKLEKGQELSFPEQCVLMVASTAMAPDAGIKPTQDYFNKQQKNQPTEMHPMIEKFIKAFPTDWQMHLSEVGAIMCGLNADGTERPILEKSKRASLICQTYIVRKQGTHEVKIGKSIHVEKRIRTLETQSGANLEVLAIIPKDIEAMLHKQFCELRTVGEWFDDSKGLIAAFATKQGGAA
ncbi:GIY-YIG nuclease family protein [Acinetobacter variabilis]|uniref:GIY-YIG nuclease family protein n=1 Tax=Acinetobacter variabilis TaxID=70346 RepID=UPI0021CFA2B0|nr:GIY-YIG nuclease family protein [Acinetobacter variabilis]MCU4630522.1 GIY-YIG nuclease family protein [Acinetobacter variabilis]